MPACMTACCLALAKPPWILENIPVGYEIQVEPNWLVYINVNSKEVLFYSEAESRWISNKYILIKPNANVEMHERIKKYRKCDTKQNINACFIYIYIYIYKMCIYCYPLILFHISF